MKSSAGTNLNNLTFGLVELRIGRTAQNGRQKNMLIIFSADDPYLVGCFIIEESELPTKTEAETHFGNQRKKFEL